MEEAVATQSETIKSMMEVIPVSEVSGKTLALVIDFCKMHLDLHRHHHHVPDEEADHLKDWAFRLFQVDQSAFFELVLVRHRSFLILPSEIPLCDVTLSSPNVSPIYCLVYFILHQIQMNLVQSSRSVISYKPIQGMNIAW